MNVETNTLPEGETDNDMPETDTSEDLDWYDPDEDQDTAPEEDEPETDEGEEAEPEAAEEEPEPPALVTLPDGTQAPLEEVTKGYLRQQDYTRKSQEVALQRQETVERRQAIEADATRIESITKAFVDHLSEIVPAQPDPSLALHDPNAYVRQKAQYDAAIAQVQKLIEIGEQPKQIKAALSSEDTKTKVAEENRILAEKFPESANPEGRKKFFTAAADAASELGFSMADLSGVTDHRLFAALHWANIGMKAAKARESAKAKVANVPPTAPRKPGQPAKASGNRDAMRKLSQSGSLKDALKVDWE